MLDSDIPGWVSQSLSAELPILRGQGESQILEYVEAFPQQARDLGKEIAAFASSNSGTILLGVSDDGDLVGLLDLEDPMVRDRLLRRLEGICAGMVRPAVTPEVRFAVEGGKNVVGIFVSQGPEPVYYCNHIPYVRHITQSRPAEPHEVIRLVTQRTPSRAAEAMDELAGLLVNLATPVADVLIFGGQLQERSMTPWLEQLLANFRSASAAAMRLAAEDVAVKNGVADAITTFGDAAKAVAVHAAGTSTPAKAWASFRTAVEHAMHAATNLEAEWISRAEPDARTVKNNLRRVRELAREVARYAAQLPDARQAGELLATQSIISSRGLYVLHLSYFPLHVLSEDDRAEMRDAGRTLHLFETRTIYGPRVESLDDIAREVMRESNRLQGLTERLASL